MKRISLIILSALAALASAPSVACTVTWQLQARDGTPKSNHPTQAKCDEAAKADKRTASTTYPCPRYLVCPANAAPPVVVPPVTPPVVVPPTQPPTASHSWVEGRSTAAEPTTARPARGVATADPAFKNEVIRISDRADPPVGFARNDYARRQAFNADNTRQLVYALDGYWHVYNAVTLTYEKRLAGPAGDAEPQWHATNPDALYYLPSNGMGMKVNELTVSTGVTKVLGDLSARLKAKWPTANAAWTKSEGSPSKDGRYWCLMVDDANWKSVGVVTWDRDTNTILGTMNTNGERPDHVSMSPSGDYCVVSGDGDRGTVAFTRDFASHVKLHHKSEHSDLVLLADGSDAYVSVDIQSNAGDVFYTNLRTGARTVLFPSYIAGTARAFHFSGKAYNVPGWVLVSTYGEYGGAQQWLDRKIFWYELATGRVLNVAFHRSAVASYFFEPHASPSRDGRLVAFSSGFGKTGNGDVDAYQVRTPPVK